ncbi:transglycosylase SLT domain-containing protein [Microvirga sp. M2]|uniref:transglycosylase SLT domain-containing protein n=1 Tax=Microvirga sp. M2 TaxID=3073270 RepID=UPI0039C1CAE8
MQAQAEGNIIPPDEAAALARAQAEEVMAAAAPEGDGDSGVAAAGKPEKSAPRPKGKRVAEVVAPPGEGPNEASVEETVSVPPGLTGRSRPGRIDAARANALRPLIVRYASENDLPFELADAVVRLESRYNAGARNGANVGLTQINVRTAQAMGYQGQIAGLLDAETNLRYGLKYLAQAYKLAGGDTCGTILRYQFGHRATAMVGASRAYCAKVKVITAAAD